MGFTVEDPQMYKKISSVQILFNTTSTTTLFHCYIYIHRGREAYANAIRLSQLPNGAVSNKLTDVGIRGRVCWVTLHLLICKRRVHYI
jgi:hypothetical protein